MTPLVSFLRIDGMRAVGKQAEVLNQLRGEILSLEGYGKRREQTQAQPGLSWLAGAFPGERFPTGAVHEFISPAPEAAAATNGFIASLAAAILKPDARCIWISNQRLIYPPALRAFGLHPEQIVFIDLRSDTEALWALEEALRCPALSVVIGELRELDFTQSRRLQLAVEQSQVTAFVHRRSPRRENTTSSLTRWKISPLPSAPEEGLPGVGFPRWQVSLLKVRNGRPGNWIVEWTPGGFRHIPHHKPLQAQPFITQTA
jgi:protein ImuA